MFNIGIAELIVIFLIAFLVVGPNDLPKIARAAGRGVKKLRHFMYDVKASLNIEEEVTEVKKAGDDIKEIVDDIKPTKDEKTAIDELKAAKQELREDISLLK